MYGRVRGHAAHVRCGCERQKFLSRPQTCSLKRRQSLAPACAAPLRAYGSRQDESGRCGQRQKQHQVDSTCTQTGWCAAEDARVSCDVFQRKFGQLQWDASLPPSSGCSSSVACDRSPNLVHVPNCSTNKCLRARPSLLPSLVPFHPRLEHQSPEGDENVKIKLFSRTVI